MSKWHKVTAQVTLYIKADSEDKVAELVKEWRGAYRIDGGDYTVDGSKLNPKPVEIKRIRKPKHIW